MSEKLAMTDRQRLTRYEIEEYYAVVERGSSRPLGRLANLSIDGLMLATEHEVKKRSVLKLTLTLSEPVLGHDSIDFDAECCWCHKGKGVDWFESGYKFRNILLEDQTTIMCLVMQLISAKIEEVDSV
jgi:hypothetical protein